MNRRERHLKLLFGLTLEKWNQMFKAQGGCCKICGGQNPRTKNGWQTDHCHRTGMVRGILCHSCNFMLAGARDNIEILEAGKQYLLQCKAA